MTRYHSLDDVAQRLLLDFPSLDVRTIAREVARAVAAAKLVGIAEDELLMIELVARAQLDLRAGQRVDVARLDPENHPSRADPPAESPAAEPAVA